MGDDGPSKATVAPSVYDAEPKADFGLAPPAGGSLDPEDWDEFRALAHRMLDIALDRTEGVRDRPVWTPVPATARTALDAPLPLKGEGVEQTCNDLVDTEALSAHQGLARELQEYSLVDRLVHTAEARLRPLRARSG